MSKGLSRGALSLSLLTIVLLLCHCGKKGSSSSSSQVVIKGDVSQITQNSLSPLQAFGLDLQDGQTINKVMLVKPTTQDVERFMESVGSNGSFSAEVPGEEPYVLVFLDTSKIGSNMIVGSFKAEALDTVAPLKTEGDVDLGTMKIADARAVAQKLFDQILEALKMSTTIASFWGSKDQLCLRYTNPDIDGNGVVDRDENKRFMLDFHVRYDMLISASPESKAKTSDIIDSFIAESGSSIKYTSTSPYAVISESFYSGSMTGATLSVGSQLFSAQDGGSFYSNRQFGPYWESSQDILSGTYIYRVSDKTLTYPNVAGKTSSDLTSATDMIVPFLRFNKTTSGTFSSVDWKWMKKTTSGFVDASKEEVKLTVSGKGGYASVYFGKNRSKGTASFYVPTSSMSGNLTWTKESMSALDGISDVTAMAASDFCDIGLSYDDKLGLRNFFGFSSQASCQ